MRSWTGGAVPRPRWWCMIWPARRIFSRRQVDSLSAAQSMQASRLLEGYFFERNGRIGIRAMLEDLSRTKTVGSFDIDGAASAGFLPLANELARRVSSGCADVWHEQRECVSILRSRRWRRGIQQTWSGHLEAATAADPGFTAGYVDEAKMLADTGDRARARPAGSRRPGERARLDPIERADLEYVAAAASGDATARMKALESLDRGDPGQRRIFSRNWASCPIRAAGVPAGGDGISGSAHLDPDEPGTWNELGYALAMGRSDLKRRAGGAGAISKAGAGRSECARFRRRSELFPGRFPSPRMNTSRRRRRGIRRIC